MISVLIVGDKRDGLDLLRALFVEHGCAVSEARQGVEALTKARQQPPDVVITELLMPVMDGFTLLHQWKRDERLRAIPVIVCAGAAREEQLALALELGAEACVTPAESASLMTRVREVVKQQQSEKTKRTKPSKSDSATESEHAAAELRDREERLRLAVRASNVGLWDWDLITNEVTYSREWKHQLGYAEHEMPDGFGEWESRVHPEALTRTLEQLRRYVAKPEGSHEAEFRMRHRDGSWRWIYARGEIIRNVDGNPVRMLGCHVDITARKQAEIALRASEARYRTLFDYAPDGIVIADSESYYLDANASICQMLGYSRDEMIGLRASDIVAPTEVQHIASALNAIKTTSDYHREWQFQRKDGSVFAAEVMATVMPDGNLLAMIHDITERKNAEAALRESEEKFAAAFRSSPVGLVITTPDGKYAEANQAYCNLIGYSREEIIGKEVVDSGVVSAEDRKKLIADINSAGGSMRNAEWRLRVRDGSFRDVVYSIISISLNGVPHRLSTGIDITERKQAEEILRKSQASLEAAQARAHVGSWEFDPQTQAGVWSREMCRIFQRDSTLPMPDFAEFGELVHLDDRQLLAAAYASALKSGEPISVDFRTNPERLPLRYLTSTFESVHQVEGKTVLLAGTTQDITERKQTEDALRVSLERFEVVARVTNDAVWDWNLETNSVHWNDSFKILFGYQAEEIEPGAESWMNRLHAEDKERVLTGIHAVIESGGNQVWCAEYRFRRRDDSYAEIFDRGYVLHDEQGKAVRMIGAMQDITERKRAEERIRQLNRTYAVLSDINQLIVREHEPQTILDQACSIAVAKGNFLLAWIGMSDAQTGHLHLTAHAGAPPATLAALELTFSDPQQGCAFTARTLATGVHATCNDIEHDSLAAPWREPALQRGYRSMASFPLMMSDHCAGTFNLYADRADFFDADELHLLDELARDIAFALSLCERERERQRALEELLVSEERFRQLAETIQDVFWIKDPADQRVLYVSAAYESIWQRSCQSLYDEPRTWLDAIHADDRERILRAFTAREHDGAYDEEYRIVRADGEIRWIRDRAFPLQNATGRIDRVVGVARDITDRHALQQQLAQSQKMQAIGTLASGIAHDFNNILAAIVGNADLARLDLQGGHPSLASIDEIIRAGQRAKELVQRILTFSRPQEQELSPIHLQSVLEEAVKLLRSTLPAGVEIHFSSAAAVPAVRADASQIHQIILNLATNAWHAIDNPPGRIDIRLEACRVDSALCQAHPELQPGPHVRLSVSDTGSGMDAATLARIFEPFFTTKPPGKGSGLGLSVVHGIVRGHGGAITVLSHPGQGSLFQLYFPASVDEALPVLAKAGPAGKISGNGEHILYIDDEEPLVYLTVRFLERLGYRVAGYTRPEEALAVFRANPADFDLVITDYNMPGISGMEVAQQLLRIQPNALIVLASGYVRPADFEQARALGIREIILKPNTVEELGPIVQRLLLTRDGVR